MRKIKNKEVSNLVLCYNHIEGAQQCSLLNVEIYRERKTELWNKERTKENKEAINSYTRSIRCEVHNIKRYSDTLRMLKKLIKKANRRYEKNKDY